MIPSDYCKKEKPNEFHLIIAKSLSFRCRDRFLESRTEFPDRVGDSATWKRGFPNCQQYFFPICNCISFSLSSVFCSLYQGYVVYVRRLERLVACWKRLIVVWIMWGPARSDNRAHGSFSRTYTRELEGAYSLLLYVSSQRYTQASNEKHIGELHIALLLEVNT